MTAASNWRFRPACPWQEDLHDSGGGAIFYGTKDTLICGCYGRNPWLVSGRVPTAPEMTRKIENAEAGHQGMDWCAPARRTRPTV